MASKRLLALTLATVIGIVTYCAQSCFELALAKPICPQHHTSDCCKHEAPTSGTLQRVAAYMPDTSRILVPTTLSTAPFVTQPVPDWAPHHLPMAGRAASAQNAVLSIVLRI